jgi:hypothetical protein
LNSENPPYSDRRTGPVSLGAPIPFAGLWRARWGLVTAK